MADGRFSTDRAARLRRVCGSSSWVAAVSGRSCRTNSSTAATRSSSSTRTPRPSSAIRPAEGATTVVGLGFDRDVLEEAGIEQADAFVAVSSGDNSNIVSARVALERFHVPKVVARIYDPRRAEIYERLNIPTVATTTWGIKQIQLMLFHDRQEIRESLGGGDLSAHAGAGAPAPGGSLAHLAQRRGQGARGRASRAAAAGSCPRPTARCRRATSWCVMLTKDGMETMDEMLEAPQRGPRMRVIVTGGGAVGRHLAVDLVERGHEVTLIEQNRALADKLRSWARGREHRVRRRVRAVGARGGADGAGRGRRGGHRRRRGQPRDLAARQAGVRGPARAGPREPPEERVALQRTMGRRRRGLPAAHPHRHGGGSRHRRRPGATDPVGRRATSRSWR